MLLLLLDRHNTSNFPFMYSIYHSYASGLVDLYTGDNGNISVCVIYFYNADNIGYLDYCDSLWLGSCCGGCRILLSGQLVHTTSANCANVYLDEAETRGNNYAYIHICICICTMQNI